MVNKITVCNEVTTISIVLGLDRSHFLSIHLGREPHHRRIERDVQGVVHLVIALAILSSTLLEVFSWYASKISSPNAIDLREI